MSKGKRSKSGSTSEVKWETELVQAPFTENHWNALVIFVVPNNLTDKDVVAVLTETVKSGLRRLYSIIDYEQLLIELKEIVAQNKASKGKTASKAPRFFEICEYVKNFLDQGETISVALIAKLIKFKMLAIKTKDIERRQQERKASTFNAKSEVTQKSKPGSGRAKSQSPGRSKSQSPGKGLKKSGKKDEKPQTPKKDTKLKKRGEENELLKTIDDEPDGPTDPQHYIILTGFTDAALLSILADIKVTPSAVIKLETDYHLKVDEKNKSIESDKSEDLSPEENEQKLLLQAAQEIEQRKEEEKLRAFWENSDLLTKNAPTGHPLRNVAKFDVFIKEECLPDQLLDVVSQEIKSEFGTWLFEKVADVCYDMLDYFEQYKRYLDHVNIVDVSVFGRQNIENQYLLPSDPLNNNENAPIKSGNINGTQSSITPPPCDLRYYDKLMSNVPVESETVPLILDCILEQVVAVTDGPNPSDLSSPPRPDGLNPLIGEYLDKKLVLYGINEDAKIWRNEQETPVNPKIIYHGDETRSKLLHLKKSKDFDPEKIEEHMNRLHPYTYFSRHLQPQEDEWMENCIRRIQLYNFCKNKHPISEEKFERAMRQYIFESLPLEMDYGTIDGDIEEQLEKIVSSFDDPYCDIQQVISESNVGKAVSEESTIETFSLRRLDHYNWLERLEPSVLFQAIEGGSDLRPYLDTYYNRGNNTLLVVLHNPSNENLQNNFTWESWLHSDVGFRNYLEHVAVEIREWTVEQERVELENKEKLLPQRMESPPPTPEPVKDRSRWGMKTRAEITAENEAAKESGNKKRSGAKSRSPKKTKDGKSPEKKKSDMKTGKPSGKKSRQTTANKRPNSVAFSAGSEKASATLPKCSKEYAFIGYNLGDSLLHVSIDHSYLFPQNGALIKIEKISYIDQDNCVQVTLMYKGGTFAVSFLNPVQPPASVSREVEMPEPQNIPYVETAALSDDSRTGQQPSPTTNESILPPLPSVPPSICSYSSVTGTFADGMIIAFSSSTQQQNKINKIHSTISKHSSESVMTVSSNYGPKSPKGKKGKKDEEARQQEENERLQREAENAKKVLERQKEILEILKCQESAKNLYTTSPNGSHLTFKHGIFIDDFDNLDCSVHTFVLKQQQCSNEREEVTLENHDAVKELYRCITENGLVLKFNSDDTVEILSLHGDIFHSSPFSKQPPPHSPKEGKFTTTPASSVTSPTNRPGSKKSKLSKAQIEDLVVEQPTVECDKECDEAAVEWRAISGRGEQWIIKKDEQEEYLEDLLISDATCFDTNQILQTREDGVMMLLRPDGSRIVEYLDGTRITTREETRIKNVVNEETGEIDGSIECTSRLVTIEHSLYPTTIVDLSDGSISAVYNNGKTIQGFKQGGYVISNKHTKEVVVSSAGEVSIYPEEKQTDGRNSYVMVESLMECLTVVDAVGNLFNVNANGDYNVNKRDDVAIGAPTVTPRYFVVYPDGSGEELLRTEDVQDYLKEAEQHQSSALIHAPVEGDEEATAVTVIKPHKGQSEIWKSKKEIENIIPFGLRERDFKTFPTETRKSPPRFSSILGSKEKPPPRVIPSCPAQLEIRHLINYKELTNDLRKEIIDGINKYGEYVQKQQEGYNTVKGVDERSEEEKDAMMKIKEKFVGKDMTETAVSELVADVTNKAAEEILAEQYIDAITPPSPPQSIIKSKECTRNRCKEDDSELEELEYAKSIIRTKEFPPYFKTKEGERFLRESDIYLNMQELTDRLASETKYPLGRSPSISSSSSDQNIPPTIPVGSSTPQVGDSSFCVDISSSLSMKYDYSSNSISPFFSSGDANIPLPISMGRPLNPTPQKAGSCENSTAEKKLQTIDETKTASVTDDQEGTGNSSILYDVTGSPRKDRVKTPASILGSRPNAVPNEKFSTVEETVRRQIKTMSVYGSVEPEMTSKLRGFVLLPDLVDFGVLREGYAYTYSVVLKNTGVDACRFKIKQPPPSTGLKIVYQPGPVAAGMVARMEIEIFAMAVGCEGSNGGVGKISYHVEITTETDILFLPVLATVITQHEFDNPSELTPRGGPSKATRLINDRPTSRETLTRPRKEN